MGICKDLSARKLIAITVLVAQSCPTLCNRMDGSPPASSVQEILPARTLEWVAIPFSRGSSQPRDRTGSPTLQADSFPSEPPRNPIALISDRQ